MSHTPGPWVVRFGASGRPVGIEAPNDTGAGGVGYIVRQNGIGPPSSPAALANARLIAAAPDFYHAATTGAQVNLPDFLEWIAARLIILGDSPNVDFVVTLHDRAKLLRAAIAKTEGHS